MSLEQLEMSQNKEVFKIMMEACQKDTGAKLKELLMAGTETRQAT